MFSILVAGLFGCAQSSKGDDARRLKPKVAPAGLAQTVFAGGCFLVHGRAV